MPYIRFSIQVDTEDEEPSRVIRKIDGTVFEYAGESDKKEQIGNLQCFLVQPGLAFEKGESLYDAMDSISDATMECYEALFIGKSMWALHFLSQAFGGQLFKSSL
jgi:hypothetical protein